MTANAVDRIRLTQIALARVLRLPKHATRDSHIGQHVPASRRVLKQLYVIPLILIAILAGCLPSTALAGERLAIGIAAPLRGSAAILGGQMRDGALAAAGAAGTDVETETADTGCTAEGGAQAGERLAETGVIAVIGFLCSDAIEAALPVLTDAGIPVITPGVRADSLTDRRKRNGWLVYRTGPRADAERLAVSAFLARLWADKLFAIVDDGTIYGRDLAESFRLAAEQSGLKPVYVDTYRPQMDNQIGLAGRLRRAGATHVFVGGDRYDIAVLGRDAASLGYPLEIAGGEALRAAEQEPALAEGTLMIGLPEWADLAEPALTDRYRDAGMVAEGYFFPAHAAMEVAIEAARLSRREEGTTVAEILDSATFDTALGSIRFDEKGDRNGNPYRLFRYDGKQFVLVEP